MDTIAAAARRTLLARREALAKRAEEPAGAQEVRAQIEAALARIEDGTYGLCEACKGAIGRQRLRAIPEARLCIGCGARKASAP